jgi:S-adenosylmethionine:diacylglycerol 3-amino-3-carboxypropyl transferase
MHVIFELRAVGSTLRVGFEVLLHTVHVLNRKVIEKLVDERSRVLERAGHVIMRCACETVLLRILGWTEATFM